MMLRFTSDGSIIVPQAFLLQLLQEAGWTMEISASKGLDDANLATRKREEGPWDMAEPREAPAVQAPTEPKPDRQIAKNFNKASRLKCPRCGEFGHDGRKHRWDDFRAQQAAKLEKQQRAPKAARASSKKKSRRW